MPTHYDLKGAVHELAGRAVFALGSAAFAVADRVLAHSSCVARWFDRRAYGRPGSGSGRGYGVGRF